MYYENKEYYNKYSCWTMTDQDIDLLYDWFATSALHAWNVILAHKTYQVYLKF